MRFDTMCNCIDENWKALKARIQASITGIKLNGTTYYQTDGTGICDLGTIETEPPTASEVLMDDGTSVQDAIDNHTAEIDNLDDGLADSVKNVEIVEVTNGLNIQTTKNGGSIEQAGLISAGANMTMTGKTIDISDALKNTIIGAVETAESASTKADDAQTDATEALTKANAAITGIGTTVVDTALEMNIDKNDGSTATEPLFTAGTNLTWDGTTLNAEGGSGATVLHGTNTTFAYNNAKVGDIIIINKTVSSASSYAYQQNIYVNYLITTGTYGAMMHLDYDNMSYTSKMPTKAVFTLSAIGIVKEVTTSRINLKLLSGAAYFTGNETDTVNINISVDGADQTQVQAKYYTTSMAIMNGASLSYSNLSAVLRAKVDVEYEGAHAESIGTLYLSTTPDEIYIIRAS